VFICNLFYLYICFICTFVLLYICAFVHLCTCACFIVFVFVFGLLLYSFIRLFICLFSLFICLFVCVFVCICIKLSGNDCVLRAYITMLKLNIPSCIIHCSCSFIPSILCTQGGSSGERDVGYGEGDNKLLRCVRAASNPHCRCQKKSEQFHETFHQILSQEKYDGISGVKIG
jgi:hypothetical protein